MLARSLAMRGPSSARTTRTPGAGGSSNAPKGTPSARASDHSVSMPGFASPASIACRVDLPMPAAAARSARLRPDRCRSRRIVSATRARSSLGSPARCSSSSISPPDRAPVAAGVRATPGSAGRLARRRPVGTGYRTMSPLSRTLAAWRRADPVLATAVPVGAAVGAYGLSYGVLAVAAGLPPAVAVLSSIVVFAGSAQFAFVGVLAAGGNPLAGAASGLLLNLRYLAFGLAVAPRLPDQSRWRRLIAGHLVIDESVAIALSGPRDGTARRLHVTGVSVMVGWVGATAIGAYGGQLLGDPRTLGLDAAFPAGFL